MKEIYNSAKICPFGQKPYDPHVPKVGSTASTPAGPFPLTHPHYQLNNHPYQHYQPYQDNPEYPNYCDMQLDPEISRILAHSRIESELLYVWKSFRDQTGPKLRNKFIRYVQLANEAAVLAGNILIL